MAQTKRAWLSRSLAMVGSTVLRIVASMADRRPEMQKPGKMAQKRQSYFAVGVGVRFPGEMAVVEDEVSEARAVSPEGGDGEMSATGAGEGIVMGGLVLSAMTWGLLPDMIDAVYIYVQHESHFLTNAICRIKDKYVPQRYR